MAVRWRGPLIFLQIFAIARNDPECPNNAAGACCLRRFWNRNGDDNAGRGKLSKRIVVSLRFPAFAALQPRFRIFRNVPSSDFSFVGGFSCRHICAGNRAAILGDVVRGRYTFGDAYNVAVWSLVPLMFLLAYDFVVPRMDTSQPTCVLSATILAIILLWSYARMLKGIGVLFDMYPTKIYGYGIIVLAVVAALIAVFV